MLDGRSIGPRRHVHQDRRLLRQLQRLVAPERGIAFKESAGGMFPARGFEKIPDCRIAGQRLFPGAAGSERCFPVAARSAEFDEKPVGQAPVQDLFRPLDGQHMGLRQFLKAKFFEFLPGGDAVEIGVGDGHAGFVIGLNKREGRTRHIEIGARRQRLDEGTGEGRFAGTQVALQQQRKTGPGEERKQACEFLECRGGIEAEFKLHRHRVRPVSATLASGSRPAGRSPAHRPGTCRVRWFPD